MYHPNYLDSYFHKNIFYESVKCKINLHFDFLFLFAHILHTVKFPCVLSGSGVSLKDRTHYTLIKM